MMNLCTVRTEAGSLGLGPTGTLARDNDSGCLGLMELVWRSRWRGLLTCQTGDESDQTRGPSAETWQEAKGGVNPATAASPESREGTRRTEGS